MGTFPTASDLSWRPRWGTRERGTGGLWIVNGPYQADVFIDFPAERFAIAARQVAAWVEGWRFANVGVREEQVSFAYLVLGSGFLTGTESGDGVLEIGFGSEPVAPPEAVEVDLGRLLQVLIDKLRAGTSPVTAG
jgi:hypothetical protein